MSHHINAEVKERKKKRRKREREEKWVASLHTLISRYLVRG